MNENDTRQRLEYRWRRITFWRVVANFVPNKLLNSLKEKCADIYQSKLNLQDSDVTQSRYYEIWTFNGNAQLDDASHTWEDKETMWSKKKKKDQKYDIHHKLHLKNIEQKELKVDVKNPCNNDLIK